MGKKTNRENAQQTFRQFAWNLAGTLTDKGQASKSPPKRPGTKG